MKTFVFLLILLSLLPLSPPAFSQTPVEGVSTRVVNGSVLPSNAGRNTIFVLDSGNGTQSIYICGVNVCMSSGDWVLSSGSGSGCAGCALQSLNNLSTVALNVALQSAAGINAQLNGCPASGSTSACNTFLYGGAASSGSGAAGNVFVQGGGGGSGSSGGVSGNAYIYGGIGGTGANGNADGGNVIIAGGLPGSYSGGGYSGSVQISTPNATNTTGIALSSGAITLLTGNPGTTGSPGYIELGTGHGTTGAGPIILTSGNGTGHTGVTTEPNIQIIASYGNSTPGVIDLDAGASNGLFKVWNGEFWYVSDGAQNFDDPTHRPNNAYFAGNVYANSFVTPGSTSTTQSASSWHAEGPYGANAAASSAGTFAVVTGTASGIPSIMYSYNGGGSYTLANMTSNISGQSGTTLAFAATPTQCPANTVMTGINVNGGCNSTAAPNIFSAQEVGTQTSASGYLTIWGSSSTHGPMYSENGSSPAPLGAYPNLFNTALGVSNNYTLEEQSGINPQALYVYKSADSVSPYVNYNRFGVRFDPAGTGASSMAIVSEAGGSGTVYNLGFGVGSSGTVRWEIANQSGFAFRPSLQGNPANNYDIGDSTHQVRNIYFGTALNLNGSWGTAGQCLISGGGSGSTADSWGSCTGGFTYPSAGLVTSTGSAFSNIAEVDGDILYGSSGSWTAGTALPGGITAPTQSSTDATTKVATDAFAHSMTPADSTANPWITTAHNGNNAVFSSSANKAAFFGIVLPFQKTTTQVSYYVGTADTTNTSSNYDLGIYSGTSGGTCTLVAHTGPIAASTSMTANAHTVSWTGGSVTLPPGRYYIAWTSAATSNTAVLYGDSSASTFAGGTSAGSVGNVSVTAGGTLDASRTCPTDAMAVATLTPSFQVN